MDVRRAPALCNLTRQTTQTPLSVSVKLVLMMSADKPSAKFTGYQYGGRPLGLTFVKYFNPNGEDVMEGTEETGGLTQDQIM